MRRAAIAAACLVLIAALGLGPPNSVDRAGAATCLAWKKHHKRVLKRVHRSGEWKRVVRVKRWRTCARRAAAPVAAPVPDPTPPQVGPEPEPEVEDPSIPRLGVKAEEWSYTLSRPEVPAGEVIVELNNLGEDPHNLNLQLDDGSGPEASIPVTGPSGQSKARFDLPAGSYRMWCSLDGHETSGMAATLVVGGA